MRRFAFLTVSALLMQLATSVNGAKYLRHPPPSEDCDLCVYLHARQYSFTDVAFPFRFPTAACAKIAKTINTDIKSFAPQGSIIKAFSQSICNSTYIKVCGSISSEVTSDSDLAWSFWEHLNRWYGLWSGYRSSTNGYCPARLNGYAVRLILAGEPEEADYPEGAPFPRSCGRVTIGTGDWCDLPSSSDTDYVEYSLPWSCSGSMNQLSTRFAIRNTYTVTSRRNTIQYCFTTTNVKPKSPNSTCGSSRTLRTVQFWADASQSSKLVAVSTRARNGAVRTSLPAWATTPPGAAPLNILRVPQLNWSPEQAEGGQICLELAKGTDINSFCLSPKRGQCWASLLDESEDCCPLYGASSPPNVSL